MRIEREVNKVNLFTKQMIQKRIRYLIFKNLKRDNQLQEIL